MTEPPPPKSVVCINCNNPDCKCEKGQCMCCPSMYWHDGHNSLLQHWRKQASINLWLQIVSNYYYMRINDWLSYPSILLSASLSIGVFGLGTSMTSQFVSAILAMLAGILVAINKHVGSPEKAQAHMLRAKDYYSFVRYLDCLLSTVFEERDPMSETMLRIKGNFNRIVDMSLEPPLSVVRSYEERFRPIEKILFTPNIPWKSEALDDRQQYKDRLSAAGDYRFMSPVINTPLFVQTSQPLASNRESEEEKQADITAAIGSPYTKSPTFQQFPTSSLEKATTLSDMVFGMGSKLSSKVPGTSSLGSSSKNVIKTLSHRDYVNFLVTPHQLTSMPMLAPSSPSVRSPTKRG